MTELSITPRRRGRPSRLDAALKTIDATEAAEAAAVEVHEESDPAPASPSIDRRDLRPSLRGDDPRARAAARAAEVRNNMGDMDEGTDDFYVDPKVIPAGWGYEWKRKTVFGQEDPAYQVQLSRTGWEPVAAERHPNMMPTTGSHKTIERKGMILMERPLELTEEARNIEKRRARQQIIAKKEQLGENKAGEFERNHAQVRPKISNSYEPLPVPKD